MKAADLLARSFTEPKFSVDSIKVDLQIGGKQIQYYEFASH